MSASELAVWKVTAVAGVAFLAGVAATRLVDGCSAAAGRNRNGSSSGSSDRYDRGHTSNKAPTPPSTEQYVPRMVYSQHARPASPSLLAPQRSGNTRGEEEEEGDDDAETSRSVELVQDCRPPFPAELVCLLQTTCLCYLSTQLPEEKNDMKYPHLSLMNFTYFAEEEVIIMTTRRDTQKLENLRRNPSVAILVHDFPPEREAGGGLSREVSASSRGMTIGGAGVEDSSAGAGNANTNSSPVRARAVTDDSVPSSRGGGSNTAAQSASRQRSESDGSIAEEKAQFAGQGSKRGTLGRTSSITLYGKIRILDGDPGQVDVDLERYRGIHRDRNEKYRNFIDGPGIAVLLFDVEFARICNIHDKVHSWRRDSGNLG
eukprot:g12356.t1